MFVEQPLAWPGSAKNPKLNASEFSALTDSFSPQETVDQAEDSATYRGLTFVRGLASYSVHMTTSYKKSNIDPCMSQITHHTSQIACKIVSFTKYLGS